MVRLLSLSALLLLISGCDSAPRYTGVGDVVAVDAAAHQVEIRHDAIAGLGDAATARFALPPGEVPPALTLGARVRFEVRRERDGLVLMGATALAAGNPGIHDHTPHHGGVVAMAGMIHLEAKADPSGRIQLYLTDVWRRPLPLADTTGTVTLDLASGKRTLPLGIAGDALEAQAEPLTRPAVNAAFALQRAGAPVELNFLLPLARGDSGAAGIPVEGCVAPAENAGSGRRPRCTLRFAKPVVAVALAPDASLLLVAQVDFGISAWRLPAAQFAVGFAPPPPVAIPVAEAAHPEAPNAILVRPDGREAVVALENRLIRYAMDSGQVVQAFAGPGGIVRSVAWSPDGAALLVSTFYTPAAFLLDAADGRVRQRFPVEREAAAVAMTADGKTIAVASQNGPVSLFDVESPTPTHVLRGGRGPMRTLAFVGDRLVGAGDEGLLRTWNRSSGQLTDEQALGGPVHAMAVDAARDRAAVSLGSDQRIRVVALSDGRVIETLDWHAAQVLSLVWGGGMLVSGDTAGRVALWDIAESGR
jgi:Cu/Ag efflux protein CusF